MIVLDELYGLIDFPEYLTPIITSPELQRLRDIRLLNVFSTSLASLSDVRRLTHTLGVTSLFLKLKPKFLKASNMDANLCKTIESACLIHDVATPAFAHLFEKELQITSEWNHETQCEALIKGSYSPQNYYHQIYYKNQLSLHERILELGVDPEQVWLTITGKAQYGQLLCGTIDLDNIDNVTRMFNSLGLGKLGTDALTIIDSILPHKKNLIFQKDGISSVKQWMQARKSCYDLLVFDEQTMSAQAMLGQLLKNAIDLGYLSEEFWYLTDNQLLYKLLDFPQCKEVIKRLTIGNTFATLGVYWFDFDAQIADWLNSYTNREVISEQLSREYKIPCFVYYLEDKGTFSKKLDVMVGDSVDNIEPITIGENSHSIVLGIFTSSQDIQTVISSRKTVSHLFESLLPVKPSRRNLPLVRSYFGINYQKEFLI